MRGSVDHVPRRVLGLVTTVLNSRLAHMICNAVRSNPRPPKPKYIERYLTEYGVDILAAWFHGQNCPDGTCATISAVCGT